MVLRLHHEQQMYMLDAKCFFESQVLVNPPVVCNHLEQLRRLEVIRLLNRKTKTKHVRSFKIKDILSDVPENRDRESCAGAQTTNSTICNNVTNRESSTCINRLNRGTIVRPWSTSPRISSPPSDETHLNNDDLSSEEEIDVEHFDDTKQQGINNTLSLVSPLDALVEMSNNAFRGLQTEGRFKNVLVCQVFWGFFCLFVFFAKMTDQSITIVRFKEGLFPWLIEKRGDP